MFQYIKATQRNRLTNSLFSSTFAICVLLVGPIQQFLVPWIVIIVMIRMRNYNSNIKIHTTKQNIHQSNKENEI